MVRPGTRSASGEDRSVRSWPNVSLPESPIPDDRVESGIVTRQLGDRDLTSSPMFGFIDSLSLDEGVDCIGARSGMLL